MKTLISLALICPLVALAQEPAPQAPSQSQQLILTVMTLVGIGLIALSVRNAILRRRGK